MAEEFETFLSDVLAPPARDPDREFVTRVQTRIAIEHELHAERRTMLRRLGVELIGLAAIAAGLLVLARTEAIATLTAQSPGLAMVGLVSIFALIVTAIAIPSGAAGFAVHRPFR
jgi:hypothetical protein